LKQLQLIQILWINACDAAIAGDDRAKALRVNRLWPVPYGEKAAPGNADTASED
jgi:hypothetical protein